MKQTAAMDMTRGPLLGKILIFSLPLMASNFLQLLFNAADVVVVGRFAGHECLAAVGSTSSIVYLFTNLLIGLAVGVNVIIARYLGQGNHGEEISRVIHTSVFIALVGGVLLGGIGSISTRWVLTMIDTPADVFDLTAIYLQIYFVGSPFVMIYNYGAAALRAMGDTRRPLLFLLLSGVVNLGLNLLFVIVFQLHVVGVAIATVISQILSSVLVLYCLACARGEFCFSWKKLRLDWVSLRQIAYVGIPAGLQSCLFSLSNVVIQSAINAYGSVIMAAVSAGSNIENFIYTSMNAFHQASQTFISQNIGAGRYDRISRVIRLCMGCTVILGVVQGIFVVCFAPELIGIYNSDPAVIEAGTIRLLIVGSVYVIFGIADVLIGSIRGYGVPIAPVIINLLGTCVFRVIWITCIDTSIHGVEWVYLSYPVSWSIILAALAVFWLCLRRRENVFLAKSRSEHDVKDV